VAVQPIPANDVKKHCTGTLTPSCESQSDSQRLTGSHNSSSNLPAGKVNLEKPLHLVIGSVSPTAVLLSWGNHLKTPYEGNVMNECLEDG